MTCLNERDAEKRRVNTLAPLMIACNALLFCCMVGLAVNAFSRSDGGIADEQTASPQRVVKDYLAQRVHSERYRVREWYPAVPLNGNPATVAAHPSQPPADNGVAQRVKLVVYGPHGARQVDTTYWIQDGRVIRTLEAHPGYMEQQL
jgi:hypothetical protein